MVLNVIVTGATRCEACQRYLRQRHTPLGSLQCVRDAILALLYDAGWFAVGSMAEHLPDDVPVLVQLSPTKSRWYAPGKARAMALAGKTIGRKERTFPPFPREQYQELTARFDALLGLEPSTPVCPGCGSGRCGTWQRPLTTGACVLRAIQKLVTEFGWAACASENQALRLRRLHVPVQQVRVAMAPHRKFRSYVPLVAIAARNPKPMQALLTRAEWPEFPHAAYQELLTHVHRMDVVWLLAKGHR